MAAPNRVLLDNLESFNEGVPRTILPKEWDIALLDDYSAKGLLIRQLLNRVNLLSNQVFALQQAVSDTGNS